MAKKLDLRSTIVDCVKISGEGAALEEINRHYEAYRKYLYCSVAALNTLVQEVNEAMKPENGDSRYQLIKLTQEWTGKLLNICSRLNKPPVVPPPHTPSPVSPQLPNVPHHSSTAASGGSVTTVRRRVSNKSSVSNLSGNDPLVLARFQSAILREHVNKRIADSNPSKQRRENMILDVEKRIVEIRQLAQKKKSQLDVDLFKRQIQLKELAERRTADLQLNDSLAERQHQGILTAVLLYDDTNEGLKSLRGEICEKGQAGSRLVVEKAEAFCDSILSDENHPLAVYVSGVMSQVRKMVKPLQDKNERLISTKITVPFKHSQTLATDAEILDMESKVDTRNTDTETFINYCEQTSKDIDTAIKKTADISKSLESSLKVTQSKSPGKPILTAVAQLQDYDIVDEMDYLFDDDGNQDNTVPSDQASEIQTSIANTIKAEPAGNESASEAETDVSLEDLLTYSPSFNSLLEDVNKELHGCINLSIKLFMSAYTELDSDDGFDVIVCSLHKHLFSGVKCQLDFLFRLNQIQRECNMAEVMTQLRDSGLTSLQVAEKWWLGSARGESYDRLVSHLSSLLQISSPLVKLQTAIQVHKGIVEVVTAYYQSKGKVEVMGADDLVPIICYIVMKTGCPQIVSQFDLIYQFIPSEYMMNEEGYCLSTYQVAVEYLVSQSTHSHSGS